MIRAILASCLGVVSSCVPEAEDCTPGTQHCACIDGELCVDGLDCLGGLCLMPGDGVDTSSSSETTTGDGDGETTTGDGDGETTTGDGDGDGDGDGETTTGDGDGETTTGDGDGDGVCNEAPGFGYIGCEFRVSPLRQSDTQFALLIENPSNEASQITVDLLGEVVAQAFAPLGTSTLELPPIDGASDPSSTTQLMAAASYEVHATAPVAMLAYSDLDASGAINQRSSARVLPSRLWSTSYVVTTWGPGDRGWYAVLSTDAPTQVSIEPSSPGDQVSPGDGVTATGSANVGVDLDAALLVTALTNVDLSGTRINSNVPFAVYAGHDAASVVNNQLTAWREPMLGLDWLGTEYVVAPQASAVANVPRSHSVRVVAVEANTEVSFEPDIGLDGELVLPGTFIDTPVMSEGLQITTSQPVLVAQFGANPSEMILAVPVEHFATDHLVSMAFDHGAPNVTVIAPNSASVQLDGNFISDWFLIGQSGYKSAYVPLNPGGAMRLLQASEPVAAHVTGPNGGVWHSTAF